MTNAACILWTLLIGFGTFMFGGWLFSKVHNIICVPLNMLGLVPYFALLLKIAASVGDFIFSNL